MGKAGASLLVCVSRAAELRPRATALSIPKSVLPCRRVCEVPKLLSQAISPLREISLKFRILQRTKRLGAAGMKPLL